jgi:hypothetical protein
MPCCQMYSAVSFSRSIAAVACCCRGKAAGIVAQPQPLDSEVVAVLPANQGFWYHNCAVWPAEEDA